MKLQALNFRFSRCATNHTPQEIKECGRCAVVVIFNRFIRVLGVQKIALLTVIWGVWWRAIALARLKIQGLNLTLLCNFNFSSGLHYCHGRKKNWERIAIAPQNTQPSKFSCLVSVIYWLVLVPSRKIIPRHPNSLIHKPDNLSSFHNTRKYLSLHIVHKHIYWYRMSTSNRASKKEIRSWVYFRYSLIC